MQKGPLPGPLATAFGGRDEVELGSYDATFASGWGLIDAELDAGRGPAACGTPQADRRKTRSGCSAPW